MEFRSSKSSKTRVWSRLKCKSKKYVEIDEEGKMEEKVEYCKFYLKFIKPSIITGIKIKIG